ncbi:hypothetical protein [Streptomyces sp. YGL11-2]|uniref:hypothetical protein n=1 Tax=Streptomyces sp. YGL11-2 TaxID=3414028 RepID=UPI003CEC65EC
MRPAPRSGLGHPRPAALVLVEGHESAQAGRLGPLADEGPTFRTVAVDRPVPHSSRRRRRTVVDVAPSAGVLAGETVLPEGSGARHRAPAATPPRLPRPPADA